MKINRRIARMLVIAMLISIVSIPTTLMNSVVLAAYTPESTYQASTAFSEGLGIQGKEQWYAQQWNGSAYANATWDNANQRWYGADASLLITGTTMKPGTNIDAVRKWVAPCDGSTRIYGNVKKSDISGGDGVAVKILQNTTTIWGTSSIAYNDAVGLNHDFTASVKAGDAIYFLVNMKTNNTGDLTAWNPAIDFTPLASGASAVEWNFASTADGWAVSSGCTVAATAGNLDVAISGSANAAIQVANLNTDITKSSILKFKYKNTTASTMAKIYFKTKDDLVLSEVKSKTFTIIANDTVSTEYTLDMSGVYGWSGRLDFIKLLPAITNTGAAKVISIDYIKLQAGGAKVPGFSLLDKEVIYDNATLDAKGLTMYNDSAMGVVRNADATYKFFTSNGGVATQHTVLTSGTLDKTADAILANPATLTGLPAGVGYASAGPVYVDPTDSNTIIGIVHLERLHVVNSVTYVYGSLGLAVTRDNGSTWTFCGEIVNHDHAYDAGEAVDYNVDAGSFLIINENGTDYFYLYANDRSDTNINVVGVSVSKAKISDVLAAAKNNTVSSWFKYYNGGWTEPGINGSFTNIFNPNKQANFTSVSYNTYLNKYIFAYTTTEGTWGVAPFNWGDITLGIADSPLDFYNNTQTFVIEASSKYEQYPTIVGLGNNNPQTESQKNFYVYYTQWADSTIWSSDTNVVRKMIVLDKLPADASCNVVSVTTPTDAAIGVNTVTANVVNATTSVTVNLTPSANATWKLYSDVACTTEIATKVMSSLAEGVNTAYAKVTAEDGTTTKVYTVSVIRAIIDITSYNTSLVAHIPAAAGNPVTGGWQAVYVPIASRTVANVKIDTLTGAPQGYYAKIPNFVGNDQWASLYLHAGQNGVVSTGDSSDMGVSLVVSKTGSYTFEFAGLVASYLGTPSSDGVKLLVYKNDLNTPIVQQVITNVANPINTTLALSTGDKLYFLFNNNGTIWSDSLSITKFALTYLPANAANSIVSATVPANATIGVNTIIANVINTTTSVTVDLTPSVNATWKLYSDVACTTEITNKVMSSLVEGVNTAYVKVTAEDGTSTKVYILTIIRDITNISTYNTSLIGNSAVAAGNPVIDGWQAIYVPTANRTVSNVKIDLTTGSSISYHAKMPNPVGGDQYADLYLHAGQNGVVGTGDSSDIGVSLVVSKTGNYTFEFAGLVASYDGTAASDGVKLQVFKNDLTTPLIDHLVTNVANPINTDLSLTVGDKLYFLFNRNVTHYNDSLTFTKLQLTYAPASANNSIVSSTIPENATIGANSITASVVNATTSITVNITPSANATWKLYSDMACTTEIASKVLSSLVEGVNTAYIKVTAQDGVTTKIYTVTLIREVTNYASYNATLVGDSAVAAGNPVVSGWQAIYVPIAGRSVANIKTDLTTGGSTSYHAKIPNPVGNDQWADLYLHAGQNGYAAMGDSSDIGVSLAVSVAGNYVFEFAGLVSSYLGTPSSDGVRLLVYKNDFTTPIVNHLVTNVADPVNTNFSLVAGDRLYFLFNNNGTIYNDSLSFTKLSLSLLALGNYKIANGMISNIQPTTTLQSVFDKIISTATIFKDSQGNTISNNLNTTNIGTGMKIVVTTAVGTKNYDAVIYGDLSGDGSIDPQDLVAAKKDLLSISKLLGAFLTAGDFSAKGKITISDLLKIKKHLLGITLITDASLKPKIKVFLLAGQSNMVGYGKSNELQGDLVNPNTNVLAYVGGQMGYPTYGEQWRKLNDHLGGGDFGPEFTFGLDMEKAYPNEKIAIIKYAIGATNLASDWEPTKLAGYYEAFRNQANAQIAALSQDYDVVVGGMLWMQGESDALTIEMANAYQQNLTNFISKVRSDLDCPQLKIVLGRISDSSAWTYSAQVRTAQQNIADADPNISIINTDDLSRDLYHYDTAGQITLGSRFATSMLGLLGIN